MIIDYNSVDAFQKVVFNVLFSKTFEVVVRCWKVSFVIFIKFHLEGSLQSFFWKQQNNHVIVKMLKVIADLFKSKAISFLSFLYT